MNNHIVIGVGEIGSAIAKLLGSDTLDITPEKSHFEERHYDFVHICFGHSPDFAEKVKSFKARFSPTHLVIHSTVPMGTCKELTAVSSPMRGKHPHMYEGLLAFSKLFGGPQADVVAREFSLRGVTTRTIADSNTSEAMKLWDTTQYGWNIILEKMIWEYCAAHKVDFDTVYTWANQTYNEGYEKLGFPEYTKYVLKHIPGKLGGHCVVQNTDLLSHEVAEVIQKFNSNL